MLYSPAGISAVTCSRYNAAKRRLCIRTYSGKKAQFYRLFSIELLLFAFRNVNNLLFVGSYAYAAGSQPHT